MQQFRTKHDRRLKISILNRWVRDFLKRNSFQLLSFLAIEDTYDGPRFDEKISLQNAIDLLEAYKAGKSLHKKFVNFLAPKFFFQPTTRRYMYQLLFAAREYFAEQPTLIEVKQRTSNFFKPLCLKIQVDYESKFTVCGDVHGQFFDLANIFEINGLPSTTK